MMLILFLNHIGVKSLLWTNGSAVADKKIPRNLALIAVRLNPSSIYLNSQAKCNVMEKYTSAGVL